MSNVWKRTLSLLLAVVLVVGMIPGKLFTVVASAAEVTDPTTAAVGDTYVVKGSTDTPAASGTAGTHWEGPVRSNDATCGKELHPHTDACYTAKDFTACNHWYESKLLGHPESCFVKAEECTDRGCHKYGFSTSVFHFSEGGTFSKKYYHATNNCQHTHTRDCYTDIATCGKEEHISHSEPGCYSYTWTLAKNQYKVNISVEGDASSVVEGSATTVVTHGDNVTFKMAAAGDAYNTWYADVNGSQVELSKTAPTDITVKAEPTGLAHNGTFNVTVKLSSVKATTYGITVVEKNGDANCSYSLNPTENILAGGTATLKVNVPGNSATAYYNPVVTVEGTGASYDESIGVITVGTDNVTVTVDYGKKTLETVESPALKINGHEDKEFENLKANIIAAAIKSPLDTSKYNVHVWIDPVAGDPRYFDMDDTEVAWDNLTPDYSLLTRVNAGRFPCANFGDTVFSCDLKVKIIENATGLTVEKTIAVTESREAASVSLGSFEKAQNTPEDFETAILNAISVTDKSGTDVKANAGLSVTLTPVEGKLNTYAVSYTIANSGETWLKTSGNFSGEFEWVVKAHKVTFKNDDGAVLSEKEYSYGTTADKIEIPTATKANEEDADGNVIARYTFKGWNPTVDTVTSEITYTATYERVVEKYTVTWVNGNETTTEEYEYGATPEAPVASKTSTAQYHFTDGTWGAISKVTGDVTYTATFTEELRSYTITWENGDETTTETYKYGENPVAPTASKTSTAKYHFTNGTWGTISKVTGDATYTATFTEELRSYTVTWIIKGVTSTETLDYGTKITHDDLADYKTASANFYFKGWKVNDSSDVILGTDLPTVTGNVTITAVFSETAVYKVTVDYAGGNGENSTTPVESGKTFTVPAKPTRSGYRFDGWYVGENKIEAGSEYTVTTDTTIKAHWVKTYTVTYTTEHHTAPAIKTYDVNTVITIADLLAVGDKTDGVIMDGWYIGDIKVSGEYKVVGDVTITAKWLTDADNDELVDGSDADPYWTIKIEKADGTFTTKTNVLNGESYAEPATIDKDYAIFVRWNKTTEGTTVTFTAVWNTNDTNNNNVDDDAETASIKVNVTGNGSVALSAANGATLTENADGTYTLLFNGKDSATQVVTVAATPDDTNATDGDVDYVITNPGTVTVVDGDNTISVVFGTHTLNANNGTVEINGYYESKGDSVVFDTLKADVLRAAGITGSDSNYKVEMVYRLGNLDLDKMTGITNALNATAFFTAVNVPESGRQFIITDKNTGVSKTVTMAVIDSRKEVSNTTLTHSEQVELGYLSNDNIKNEIATALGIDASLLGTPSVTAGQLPVKGGDTENNVTYSVEFSGNADWQKATITITYAKVYKNADDCTVKTDGISNGSLYVNDAQVSSTTVAGLSNVTVGIRPQDGYYVSEIVITGSDGTSYTFGEADINYTKVTTGTIITSSYRLAKVSFTTDGSTGAVTYTVTATLKANSLTLKENQTIVYCVDDKDHTYDLQKMVFDAIFGGSNANMTKDNVTLEFSYTGDGSVKLWADVSKDPAINIGSLTHKFGEYGSETIKLTYSDDKYGSFEQTVVLNVFDSCYSSTVSVETQAPEGTKYNFSVNYSEDARTYQGINYYKAGTSLTVSLTPSGEDILGILEQIYNKTYSESSPYIKDVKVYAKDGDQWVLVESTMTRGNGELIDWDDILNSSWENPMAYNASVTFDVDADTQYKIVAEYDILKLEQAQSGKFQMEMYKGGPDYEAKVPSAQDMIDTILGKEYAANFLATYGGAFTVEFSTDLINYSWKAVSEEALLALNDAQEIVVRITWNPTEDNKTYYPLSVKAEPTLVDKRTATSVQGEVPSTKVEYVSEDQLIENLKKAMGLGILANGNLIEVEYEVNYTITVETDGTFAKVIVTYHGSPEYKPCTKTFENVPVEDIPDNATVKVTISGAAVNVTNNAGSAQSWDPSTGLYTVIGNGTYNFQFTPVSGKAIESVTVNGEKVTLTYNKGVATFSMYLTETMHYDVIVETVDSIWKLEDERLYDFAYGVMDPVNKDIVDAAVKYPADGSIDYNKVIIEYLARAEGTVAVELGDIDLGFTVIELGTIDIELGELWLDPNAEITEYDLDKLIDELIEEVIDKVSHGQLAATEAADYITNKLKGLTIGSHAFGSNGDGSTETIRINYADDKFILSETVTDVTTHDYRIVTELVANDCNVTYGYSLNDLLAASGASVFADGAVVSGLKIETNDLYLHAGQHTITLYFAGDINYQPCEITLNVTVNKATVEIDYDSQNITYGDSYDFAISIAPSKHNDSTAVDPEMIEFLIGLDMAKTLDFSENQDIVGLGESVAFIQLRLPKSIRELPLVGEYLQGEFTLTEFTKMINDLDDILGLDEGSMEILNQVVEAITGFTDNTEIKVIVKDEDFHPTNIGVYIAGAVTIDADYETAYTADYLIIAPTINEVGLDWNATIDDGVATLPAWNRMDKGASVVGDEIEDFAVKYLILGINTDSSEFLTTDIYGNIKANIWLNPADVKDNGAYVQIAYGVLWGNDLYYAVPLVRAFALVPGEVNVELVGANGKPNDEMLKEFNNKEQGFSVIVTDDEGNVIYSDHYQNIVDLGENAQIEIRYIGIQTNGTIYNSTEKPVHAGVYTVYAIYLESNDGRKIDFDSYDFKNIDINKIEEELYELFDLVCIGVDFGLLVIEPTDSTIVVEDKIVIVDPDKSYDPADQVSAGSTVSGLTPDTTIITAGIASNGTYTDNGWDAVNGTVNVDFPKWIDKLIAQYAPGVVDGITIADLSDKLMSKLPEITAALKEHGASNEVLNSFANAINSVVGVLDQMPGNVVLTFKDDITYTNVGAYIVIATVTDSDHYPSVDAGLLVITPEISEVELKWNYEDENGIFTRELLTRFDLWASAFNKGTTTKNDEATAKITYQFIGINSDNEPVIYTDPANLPNGAYIEIAYIAFELDGKIIISDMIARPIVVAPNNCSVEVENLVTTFDNTGKNVNVSVYDTEGNLIDSTKGEFTFLYTGVQTNGKPYQSDKAPVHAGVYEVTVLYVERDENGEVRYYGAGVGYLIIGLTQSSIDVTGDTVVYDGNGYTASVETGSTVAGLKPDYILISGGAYISGNANEVGVDALHGNVNIDLPKWLDAILSQYEWFDEGVDRDYLIEFITAYRDDLIAAIPVDEMVSVGIDQDQINSYIDKMNASIDQLLMQLAKLPEDVNITFVDGITYTEPGYYLYYGIVADSDHYPATDTGLLVIEKKEMILDLLDTEIVYDGNGHVVKENNPNNADYMTVIIDRENNIVNILLDEDAQHLLNKLAEILGVEFDGDVQISTIINNYSGKELAAAITKLIGYLETSELSEELAKVLTSVKTELETLPENGTVMINGELPTNVGVYEFYAISFSQYYKTVASEAVLNIVPAEVTITINDQTKVYGDEDPKLTYDVTFGTGYVSTEELGVVISRVDGENVGEYTITASYNESDNYNVIVVDGKLKITKRPVTITVIGNKEICINGSLVEGDFDVSIENAITSNPIKVTVDISNVKTDTVGSYDVIVKGEYDTNNYDVTINNATVTVVNHDWSVKYEWSEDGKTCTATHVCGNNAAHNETATATVTSKVTDDPTCTEKGETTYTATFTESWATTQTKVLKDVPATDHDWSVKYEWSEDGKTCTATHVCGNNAAHNETVSAVITSKQTKNPSCTEKGETTYTATFTESWATTQTKVLKDVPATGHTDVNEDHKCDNCGIEMGQVKVPVIGIPSLTGDNIYGFAVDYANKRIYIDTVKTGLTIEQFVQQLEVPVFNDTDSKAEIVVSYLNETLTGTALIRTEAKVSLTAENEDGKITVVYDVVVIGDVNRNGEVDSGDASLIQRYFFKEVELTALQADAADTNRSGEIESGDAVKNQVKYNDAANYQSSLHSYTECISNDDATCEKDGTMTLKCTANHNCSAKSITVPEAGSAKEHKYVLEEGIYVCDVCDKKKVPNV